MTKEHARAELRELTREECDELLARNHVGRIAFSFRDRVDIQPISYVYDAGWIFGRTSEGHKIATIERNRWVAFEVDEARDVTDWRSVVVRGGFYLLEPNGLERDAEMYRHAVELLRRLVPATLTDRDPFAARTLLFRVHAQEVTGREATPAR